MKEIKIIQYDDGKISIETSGSDGQLVTNNVDSIDAAIDHVKGEFDGIDGVVENEEPMPVDESGPVAASKGKKLEDNLPVVDDKKKGMMPEKNADWRDYSL